MGYTTGGYCPLRLSAHPAHPALKVGILSPCMGGVNTKRATNVNNFWERCTLLAEEEAGK